MCKQLCSCGGFHIKLMPDYSSSALWCNNCGSELDEYNTEIPIWLLDKIRKWNEYWESNVDRDYQIKSGFNEEGLKLAIEVNKWHPCLLFISDEK